MIVGFPPCGAVRGGSGGGTAAAVAGALAAGAVAAGAAMTGVAAMGGGATGGAGGGAMGVGVDWTVTGVGRGAASCSIRVRLALATLLGAGAGAIPSNPSAGAFLRRIIITIPRTRMKSVARQQQLQPMELPMVDIDSMVSPKVERWPIPGPGPGQPGDDPRTIP